MARISIICTRELDKDIFQRHIQCGIGAGQGKLDRLVNGRPCVKLHLNNFFSGRLFCLHEVTDEKTGRVVIVDECHQSCGVSAELAARIVETGFDKLKAGIQRVNTFRDPAQNECINLEMEDYGGVRKYQKGNVFYGNQGSFSPVLDQLDALMIKGAEAAKRAGR